MSMFVSVCVDSYISVPILMNVQPYISLPSLCCCPPCASTFIVSARWRYTLPSQYTSLFPVLDVCLLHYYLLFLFFVECACRLVGCERANWAHALVANTSLTYICVLCLGCERANRVNAPIVEPLSRTFS